MNTKIFERNKVKSISLVIGMVYLLFLLTCCAPTYNIPKMPQDHVSGVKRDSVIYQDDSTLAIACFSGGGFVATEMCMQVMKHLDSIHYKTYVSRSDTIKNSLLDEIDYISSVSGGSFAAAALALYRDSLEEFRARTVKRNMQLDLAIRWKPWNWLKCVSPYYSRADRAAEYYDERIFFGKRFSDVHHPKLWINATILKQGVHFLYTPDYFDAIGSEYDSFHVAWSVMASSAFPGGFPPIFVNNWGSQIIRDSLMSIPKYRYAFKNRYTDVDQYNKYELYNFFNNKKNHWIWNQDGGLAGNTGIRKVLDEWETGGVINKAINNQPLKRMIILVVNACRFGTDNSTESGSAPKVLNVIFKTTTTAMDALTLERIDEVQKRCDELWQFTMSMRQVDTWSNSFHLNDFERPYVIIVDGRNLNDDSLKIMFNNLPTSFKLNKDQLNVIRLSVHNLLENNAEYNRLKEVIESREGR